MTRKVDPLRGLWRVDLHSHTWASPDSLTDPAALIERAREIGLARLAITDHNTIEGALASHALAPDLIIVGEEITTETGGEVIAYFVTEPVPRGLSLAETLRQLRQQGAVISVSHPCDTSRHSALGEARTLSIIDQVDALEVFNARCARPGANQRAEELAQQFGKARTAGSDAHTVRELGAAVLLVPPFRANAAAMLASLQRGRPEGRLTGPLPHLASRYARLIKLARGR